MSTPHKDADRVVIYARISEDMTGDAAGVSRQLEAGRELAASRGFIIVTEATDNDLSALRGKDRPGYRKVLDLVRAEKVDHVICWQTSRLLRNRRERAEAIELFSKHRVGILAVKGISFDLTTAYGRGQAGLLGEFDTMESEVKAERVAAAAADRAKRGRPNGRLGYGWITVGQGHAATYTEHPQEAPVVREIVSRLLSGESLAGVTEDLNTRGTPPPLHAERWGKTSVKKIALRASNAAVRVHHRGQADETLYAGVWPALVTREDWEKVTALLSDPARTSNAHTRPGARRHLLTWGVGECGVCGGRLRVGIKGNATWGTKKALYLCEAKGCTGRNQEAVDELVGKVTVARLQRPDALDWLLGDDDAARKARKHAAALNTRLDDAADEYAAGKITKRQLERITSRLLPEIEAAESEAQQRTASVDTKQMQVLAGPKAQERWDAMTVSEQRQVLEVLGMRVILDRVTKRGPGFDPESVRVEWKS